MAHDILVNSKFTQGIFKDSFKFISKKPLVLYPGIRLEAYEKQSEAQTIKELKTFERKKELNLAIEALAHIIKSHPNQARQLMLIVAGINILQIVIQGGYDPRVNENVEHLQELRSLADSLGLKHQTFSSGIRASDQSQILFFPSFTDAQRSYLFSTAECLLYTPSFEHFGIVPLEAMYCSIPVVAANNGGPTESIVHGSTGLLVEPTGQNFGDAIADILGLGRSVLDVSSMKSNAKIRVEQMFSLEAFTNALETISLQLVQKGPQDSEGSITFFVFIIFISSILCGFYFQV